MKLSSTFVSIYAFVLAVAGFVLLFMPEILVTESAAESVVSSQLVGAALLGFAAANWTARSSVLGGIYGKAVTAGNQVFAFIASMALLSGLPSEPSWSYMTLTAILICGAVLFSILQFRPDWIDRPKQKL